MDGKAEGPERPMLPFPSDSNISPASATVSSERSADRLNSADDLNHSKSADYDMQDAQHDSTTTNGLETTNAKASKSHEQAIRAPTPTGTETATIPTNQQVSIMTTDSATVPSAQVYRPTLAPADGAAIIKSVTEVTISNTPVHTHVSMKNTSAEQNENHGKALEQNTPSDSHIATNEKGSGRSQPNVKRGSRKSQPSESNTTVSHLTSMEQPLSPMPVTPSGSKRKRADSSMSNIPASSKASSVSRDSTPEYNPTNSQTRSGRQTQRPVSMLMNSTSTESPAPKKSTSAASGSTPSLKTHPKIKRRVYKGKEASALCEHCLRGFGPPDNVIVFCDACNKCWHQRCHQPQIPKEVVTNKNAEWFCATCDKILHGNKKAKKTPSTAAITVKTEMTPLPPPPPPIQRYGMPLIGAISLNPAQRKTYLNTLNKEQLITLILRAGDLAPHLPMYETPLPLHPPPAAASQQLPPPHLRIQPQFASNYVTPVDVTITEASNNVNQQEAQDEGYDDRFDEHAVLYPKPGQGVQLPPDKVDLHILLEGSDSRTFSHWVRGSEMKRHLDNITLVQG